ncbi:hypothetical protein BJ875DRAFT_485874 [Amylocarpus encephaloides]|uniref:Uncharacterized protein n=1 Tax=Amylocarpus encephaloides TaxID=45428 RepID=A0A9P7YEZ3_9HELO|nr:hypothetical protein BJ875DRAFT_485874 [Amylocarpus encephaloides]
MHLTTDNTINITIGILTTVIGILSSLLAWVTLRITYERLSRRRQATSQTSLSDSLEGFMETHTDMIRSPSQNLRPEYPPRSGQAAYTYSKQPKVRLAIRPPLRFSSTA